MLALRAMKLLCATIVAGCLLAAPAVQAEPPAPPPAEREVRDARLVPTLKDGVLVGLKVFAIKPGGRFDQPQARFANGDLIVAIDDAPASTDAGQRALVDKVIDGKADAVVTVERRGARLTLHSKAVSSRGKS